MKQLITTIFLLLIVVLSLAQPCDQRIADSLDINQVQFMSGHRFNFSRNSDSSNLYYVYQFGNAKLGSTARQFYGCTNLSFSELTDYPDTSAETSFDSMFKNCFSITDIPFFNNWDVRNVVYMGGMLYSATNANPDCTNWQTDSVLKLGNTFNGSSFNRNIGGWDISNINNFGQCLNNTNMSTASWDATLIGWSGQSVISNQSPSCNANFTLGGAAEAARKTLTDPPNNWTITDNGGI